MPELLPFWRQLVGAADASDLAATMLTFVDPPAIVRACSQVVVPTGARDRSVLVRNYDWDPDLFDGVVLETDMLRGVIGTSDLVWGLLDGVNEDGLAASLTFGGRRGTGPGFGIPLVIRYLLETSRTVSEAVETLVRLPVHAAYSVTLVDKAGNHATVHVGPDRSANVVDAVAVTNHQEQVAWPEHDRRYRSTERLAALRSMLTTLGRAGDPVPTVVSEMLNEPLRSRDYTGGFGTLYTAVLDTQSMGVTYHWPNESWSLQIGDRQHGERTVSLAEPSGSHQAGIPTSSGWAQWRDYACGWA